jgi:hypothetical protein
MLQIPIALKLPQDPHAVVGAAARGVVVVEDAKSRPEVDPEGINRLI